MILHVFCNRLFFNQLQRLKITKIIYFSTNNRNNHLKSVIFSLIILIFSRINQLKTSLAVVYQIFLQSS